MDNSLLDATATLLSARETELTRVQHESEVIKSSIASKEETLASLTSELEKLRGEARNSNTQPKDELEKAMAECARRLEEVKEWAENQIKTLEKEKEAEKEELQKQLNGLRDQNDKMLAEIRDPLKNRAAELQERKSDLERANTALETKLSTLQADHAQKLMRMRSQLSDTMEEADSLRENIEATQTRLKRVTRDSGNLLTRTSRQQHSQQVAQRACLVTQAQELEQQLARALNESEARVGDALKEIEQLKRNCVAAEEEMRKLEADAKQIESVNKEADAVIARQQSEMDRLARLIRTETGTRERLRLELERLDRVLSFSVRTDSPIITEVSRRMSASLYEQ